MILDTNGLSAMADGDPALDVALRRADDIALPAIVLGEYRYGIARSRHRSQYEDFLATLTANSRVLRVDEDTAHEYAAIRSDLKQLGRPIPANDAWIAALARQHALPVLSRDAHFDFVPKLTRISW